MNQPRKLLAVCGMIHGCREFVRDALLTANKEHAELYVLAVIDNPFGVRGLSFPRPSLNREYRKLVESTKEELQDIAAEAIEQNIPVQTIVREGKPIDQILAVIRENRIDLLVMQAQKQSWLESLLSERYNSILLRKMPCSILYIKHEPGAVEEDEESDEDEEKAA